MLIDQYKNIFFDFDGVIKESVLVKAEAFKELFAEYGHIFSQKVWNHHMQNGGLSRADKIKLYLSWAEENPDTSMVDDLVIKFGNLVKANVTNSPWVPGIESLIKAKKDNQIFILVSAAPKQELQDICDSIGISKFFNRIYGSEVSKTKAISESISIFKMSHTDCVMIGDYKNDMVAARNNKISFILRSHEFNRNIKVSSNVRIIENFLM